MEDEVTRIELLTPTKEIAVEMAGADLDYNEFMELIEMLIINAGYSEHEYESYILEWAADIKSKREN